jgi:4-hydroxy-tetrahydrodipicolinate synthase
MAAFEGVCPIVSTPFASDGSVDYGSLESQIAALAQGGCHGAILFGLAGEFYKLTDEEQGRIVSRSVAAAENHDVDIYVSVTAHATNVAVDRAEAAVATGADGLMLLPPFVNGPSEDDIRAHVEAVGEAVDVPVMVQYAPDVTGVTISPSVFAAISEDLPNVNRYKVECTPPGGYTSALLEQAPDDVAVLVGSGGKALVEALDRGCVGVVPGVALHELYVDVVERYRAGDRAGALERHHELLPYLEHIGQDAEMFIHYEKRVLAERGFIRNPTCRDPSFDPDEHYDALFEDVADPLVDAAGALRED